jgi:putative membrane protein
MYATEWGWHHGQGMWFGGGLLLIVVIILLFLIATRSEEKGSNSARDILDERYARGEIDREEYLQKLKDLQG